MGGFDFTDDHRIDEDIDKIEQKRKYLLND